MAAPALPIFITDDWSKLGILVESDPERLRQWEAHLYANYPGVKLRKQSCDLLPRDSTKYMLHCKCGKSSDVSRLYHDENKPIICPGCKRKIDKSDREQLKPDSFYNCLVFGPLYGQSAPEPDNYSDDDDCYDVQSYFSFEPDYEKPLPPLPLDPSSASFVMPVIRYVPKPDTIKKDQNEWRNMNYYLNKVLR